MIITKRIFIVALVFLAIIMVYLFTSLIFLFIFLRIHIDLVKAKFWAFNTFNGLNLTYIFMIVFAIISKFNSFHDFREKIRFQNLRTIEPFKILISIGVAIMIVPLHILIYALFLIGSTIGSIFGLTLITTITGFGFSMVGVYLNVRKK